MFRRRIKVLASLIFLSIFLPLSGYAVAGLNDEEADFFRLNSNVLITVDQDYGKYKDVYIGSFDYIARRILNAGNINILSEAGRKGCAKLRVYVKGVIEGEYSKLKIDIKSPGAMFTEILGKPSNVVFTKLSGTITFETEGGEKHVKSFDIDNLSINSTSLRELSFFRKPLLELIAQVYGSAPLITMVQLERYPVLREEARELLLARGNSSGETVTLFIDMLKSENKSNHARAQESLIRIGSSAVVPLIGLLKDKDIYIRARAVDTLGKIGDSRAVDPLLESLRDKSGWSDGMGCVGTDSRSIICGALGLIGKSAVVPLINFLEDSNDVYARVYVVRALGVTGDSRAVKPLADILKDASEQPHRVLQDGDREIPDIYNEAAISLVRIGEPAISSLIAISTSGNPVAGELADKALKQIQTEK